MWHHIPTDGLLSGLRSLGELIGVRVGEGRAHDVLVKLSGGVHVVQGEVVLWGWDTPQGNGGGGTSTCTWQPQWGEKGLLIMSFPLLIPSLVTPKKNG